MLKESMLTVLMATYNGAKTLSTTLEAFCRLEEPNGGWKLVVVDNGSTDQTQEVTRFYCGRLPMTIVYEPARGQNTARNSGLNSIAGDLVVFTDDDVIPRLDWLVEMRSVADQNPLFAIFGGPVLPKWESPPEDWVRNLDWVPGGVVFLISNPNLEEGPIDPDLIWSPNMAVRADIFEAGHRFDTAIGPDGSDSYPMGSETEFIRRMDQAGFKPWFSKRVVVYHMVRSHQMDQEWALKRAVRFGRGRYRIWAKRALNSPTLRRISSYLIRQTIIQAQISMQTIRVACAQRGGDADKLFEERWWLNYYIGKALEGRAIGISGRSL
jgi:glycosyltransferase involved in cell wall biosynthesis